MTTNRKARRQAAHTGRNALTAAAPGALVRQVARNDDGNWEARLGDLILNVSSDRLSAVEAVMDDFMEEVGLAASAGFAQGGPEFVATFVEGEETRDGGEMTRIIDPGAIRFDRPFPLPIMATTETSWGHEGAELVGVITNATIASPVVTMTGQFDTSPRAVEVARMVDDGILTRHSPDLGSDVSEFECTEYEADEWGEWCTAGTLHFREAVVLGTTILPFPALDSAVISLVAQQPANPAAVAASAAPDGLIAAARAVTVPAAPARVAAAARDTYPAAWFEDPQLTGPTVPQVTADGRYFGHLACFDTCHIGQPEGPDVCTTPPRSETGYAAFHTGPHVDLDNGTRLRVGRITVGTGHAGLYGLTPDDAAAHYDNTGTTAAIVRAGEDEWGIWVAGAVRPDLDDWTLWALQFSPLSGDWRGSPLDLVAALAVNVPGFPIPDVSAVTAGGECVGMVAAGARTMALVASAQRPHVPAAPVAPDHVTLAQVMQRLDGIERRLPAQTGPTVDELTARVHGGRIADLTRRVHAPTIDDLAARVHRDG